MLKKMKGKMKRRNTEPFMAQVAASGSGTSPGLSIAVVSEQGESLNHNNEF